MLTALSTMLTTNNTVDVGRKVAGKQITKSDLQKALAFTHSWYEIRNRWTKDIRSAPTFQAWLSNPDSPRYAALNQMSHNQLGTSIRKDKLGEFDFSAPRGTSPGPSRSRKDRNHSPPARYSRSPAPLSHRHRSVSITSDDLDRPPPQRWDSRGHQHGNHEHRGRDDWVGGGHYDGNGRGMGLGYQPPSRRY